MLKHKFFRKDLEKWISAPPEVWQWEATYEDGGVLKQFGDDGVFHQFAEIDQERLAMFKMVSPEYSQTYTLLFSDPAMKLIHFYRNKVLNAGTADEERIRYYCFGYEKRIGTKVHKTIMMITPTNDLVVTEEPALVTSSNDSSS
ncbi:hypothetical protein A2210_01075 [Candidatus Woesebacteria bacterium RIFOXYA1_FULL_40_18]|uniref:Uncharacterized protein n=1 Tax=Candidatus Woesebacteria bacterium RIFOXYA1_FULL_40_18 TaxID=1802532 RepID=A0A1F8CJ35_9BACT|nr:MAG: hypothetical protein A2210_01075 [Candidatus Woesebacteria bacterium RIFOXYA1_FULL_40_18]